MPVVIIAALLFSFWIFSGHDAASPEIKDVRIGNVVVHAEVVATSEAHAQGLSGRERLEQGEGMLFIFAEEGLYSFWMKDMLFPIDIIWISAEKKVVHIEEHIVPETYPSSFESPVAASYVLEVPAGFVRTHNISTNISVTW